MKFAAVTGAVPVFAALLLGGACSSQMQRSAPLDLEHLTSDHHKRKGITGLPYFLPDTVVPLTISGDFVLLPERKDRKPPTDIDYEYVVTVTVGATKQVADPNAPLILEYQPEAGTNDAFKLAVGANGLLNNVNSTSKDESAAIIVKLAELAREGLRTVTALAPAPSLMATDALALEADKESPDDKRRRACAATLQKMAVTTEINLSDVLLSEGSKPPAVANLQTDQLNDRVVKAMLKIPGALPSFDQRLIQAITLSGKTIALPGNASATTPSTTPYPGIIFRLMTPRAFGVDLSSSNITFGKTGCSLQSQASYIGGSAIMVADPRRTFVVDNSRTAFVAKKVNLTVADGVLLGIDVDKPSELLAAISLPVDVLKVIASIPGEILSVKVKQLSDQNNLSAAQVKMLELQIDMIKQRQSLIDAQNGTTK